MSSDIQAKRQFCELGHAGKNAQKKEFQRQLRFIPRWLAAQKRQATKRTAELKRKIAALDA